jgi:hypothetical protein
MRKAKRARIFAVNPGNPMRGRPALPFAPARAAYTSPDIHSHPPAAVNIVISAHIKVLVNRVPLEDWAPGRKRSIASDRNTMQIEVNGMAMIGIASQCQSFS